MVEVDAILIDEVLAVGGRAFQQKCFDALHKLRDEGKTIMYAHACLCGACYGCSARTGGAH